jgi:ribonuclease-3
VDDPLAALQARLQHRFSDPRLLARALTHRSFSAEHNERLEFLGDSVLSAAISEALYARFPKATEGELTRWRASLVREGTLAAVARELGIGDVLKLGPGELKSGGFRRDSILADALEAVIGAVHLDGGFEAARDLVLKLFAGRLDDIASVKPPKDAKTRLQEWLQARGFPLPTYELTGSIGSDHDKVFFARCLIPDLELFADGEGASRRAAETAAAEGAMARIDGGLTPPLNETQDMQHAQR